MENSRNNFRNRSIRNKSIGREKAIEHIRQAEALTQELGGTDVDVKNYLFSLPANQLREILKEYEVRYGSSASDYAEKTLPKWKSGSIHMSGMIAERLFNLLPPRMPLEIKFQLIENLWRHVGPSSTKNYFVGLDVSQDDLSFRIKEHLEKVVLGYQIPNTMESRFNWLSQGDVEIKQILLNHFQQQEKTLLSEALRIQFPALLNHLNSERGNFTTHAAQILNVGKHSVQITFNKDVTGISETSPAEQKTGSDYSWIWWVVGAIFVIYMLMKK